MAQKLFSVVVVFLVCLNMVITKLDEKKDECHSFLCFTKQYLPNLGFNNETPLSIEDLIRQEGYPVESHVIKTEDGYLLTYHRIPGGKEQKLEKNDRNTGIPVLVQHGLVCSSPAWVISRNSSLAFLLADSGYDVWLGNSRGNTYSRQHVYLDPDKDSTFWNFSFHEMGTGDLPAAIDYILSKTGRPQLFYVGHSMGSTMFYVMGAMRPFYLTKVKAMVALAPIVNPWNIKSPITKLSIYLHRVLEWVFSTFNINELCPHSSWILWLDNYICSNPHFKFICDQLLKYLDNFNSGEKLKRTPLARVLEYIPGGASFKTLEHFNQLAKQGGAFSQFDYGLIPNLFEYYSFNPPMYELSKVQVPMYVYYGNNDWLAVPEDVLRSMRQFPNIQRITKVPHPDFNHLDFMWALDAKHLLYKDIVDTLDNITNYLVEIKIE